MVQTTNSPHLLFATEDGQIVDFPELGICGMSNNSFHLPSPDELIPLPPGSEIFVLPERLPIGWDRTNNEPILLNEDPFDPGQKVQAVAAFIAPAHTSIYSAAYQSQEDCPTLPLFAYTAVGWMDGSFWVCAFRSDHDKRQDSDQYEQQDVVKKTHSKLRKYKKNRLIQHLGKCCLTYGCPAARNYFLGRWEAPLPTSPSCNARCLGCISLQESGCCPATQDRIKFVPTADEICELAVPHLRHAENPIVSFGQGCEGEPLMQAGVILEAIVKMRQETSLGTINLNSNASRPAMVEKLAHAGLDSMRVSLNSAQETYYNRYYRPQNYSFSDVTRSIEVMKNSGRFISLNYFIAPGFTDTEEELDALIKLILNCQVDFIQLRNLNMDPEYYFKALGFPSFQKPVGVINWLKALKKECPTPLFGYFNPQVNP